MKGKRGLLAAGAIVALAVVLLVLTDSDPVQPPNCPRDCVQGQRRLGMSEADAKTYCRDACKQIAIDQEMRGAPR